MKTKIFAIVLLLLSTLSASANPFPFSFWKTTNNACVDETFQVNSTTLTGSVIRHGLGCSPSGTYCFGVATEILASFAATYHFYYSKDGGINWTKAAFTDSVPTGQYSEDTQYGYIKTPEVIVADNGKAFALYQNGGGGVNFHVKGVYSDLSAGSPTVSQSAATGVDAENSVGTAGYICANTTNHRQGWVEADRTDLSFIAVACVRQNDTLIVRFFTNGGATYQNSDLTADSHYYGSRVGMTVTGSGSSHRAFIFRKDLALNILHKYYDQPSATPVASGSIFAGDYYIYDCDASSSKGYCLVRENSTDAPQYFSWNIAGTPTYSAMKALAPQLDLDEYIGLDVLENLVGQIYNYGRIPGPQVVINPSDTNNVFFMTDLLHADGIVRPWLHEVRDDTAWEGPGPSNTTVAGNQNQGYSVGASEELGQTFTATGTRLRTFSFRVRQVGRIAAGNTLHCELYATSGNLPTGAALATSLNTYVESEISTDVSYQHVTCLFSYTTVPSTVYAVTLKTTHTISTTNFLNIPSGSGYAGGQGLRFDGTNWNGTGDDLVFEVNGEWIYDVSKPMAKFNRDTGLTTWGTDSSISKTSTAGTIALLTKKSPVGATAQARRQSGHAFKSQVTIGSGATASTIGTLVPAGYPVTTFEPGMVFQTQPGTTESSRKNQVTGVISSTEKAEDRSGMNATAVYTGVTYRAEAGCDSGQAIVFDASGDKVDYGAGTLNVYDVGHQGSPFSVEAQFVLDTLPSSKGFVSMIASKYTDGTANQGWLFYVNTANKLVFQFAVAGGVTTASTTTFATGTVYRVKATGDGTTVRLYVHNGTTWVEEAYSAQVTTGYSATTTTDQLEIGNEHNNGSPYDLRGAICYVKIQKGANDMVATGYTSQPEMLAPILAGKIQGMEQGIGTGSLTIDTGFNQWGTTVPNACYP